MIFQWGLESYNIGHNRLRKKLLEEKCLKFTVAMAVIKTSPGFASPSHDTFLKGFGSLTKIDRC